jgi:ADP-dependent NAD(P)H-hydrate dehydratase / NAD(P)H-hydrate epimerase
MTRTSGPHRISAAGPAHPLHNAAATRAAEALQRDRHPPGTLMARAGLAVAQLAMAMAPHARLVRVSCGPGNNGGDGLVAARHLHEAGKQVLVTMLGDPARLPPDAAAAFRAATAAGVALRHGSCLDDPCAPPCDLAIDALLGLGADRATTGDLAAAITALNQCGAPVLAVDIPSGLHPDTGTALGGPLVRAQATLSLLTLKPGCFTAEGRDHAGQVWLDSLGALPDGATAFLTGTPADLARLHASHKGRHGDVAVVGGAPGMVGAAWLAARAALAAGAGRVFVSLLDEQAAAVDLRQPELMSRPRWWRSTPEVLGRTTVVCGCGAGERLAEVLPPLLAHAARLVLDADALNALAVDASLLTALRARAPRGRATVLTPHPLEAARLLGCSVAQVQADRLDAASTLAERYNATVVLKGSGSVVATPGALPRINPTGNGALATAGTGDVLAGWIAGLWAQADVPDTPAGAVAAAAAEQAVWHHGHAADRFVAVAGTGPLRAAELVEWMAGHGRPRR